MTDVTYTDPPNDPAQPLEHAALEPIEFTCLRALDWLMVDMGQGFEECAFREGQWRGPYAALSSIGGDFLSGTILRAGGWLGPPLLIPQIVPEPATQGQALGAIYELDLTAQPSQAMTTPGPYTIDNKTWWAKGTLGSTGALNALVNGSGLRLFEPATIDIAHRALWRGTGATQPFTARVLGLKLDEIADFNPLAPYALEWRFTSPAILSGDASRCPIAGVIDLVASAAALTGASKDTSKSIGLFDPNNAYFIRSPFDGSSDVNFGPTALGTTYGNIVQGIYKFSTSRYYPLAGAWSGALATPNEYTAFNANVTPAFTTQGLSNTPSFFFCLDKAGDDGHTVDVYLTHLRVLQPRVA